MTAGIDLATRSGLQLLARLADMRLSLGKPKEEIDNINQDMDKANEAFESLNTFLDGIAEWCALLETKVKEGK